MYYLGLIFLLIGWSHSIYAISLGQLAPNFNLQDTNGEVISLLDFRTKHIVLEWFNPDCVEVQQLYQQKNIRKLAKQYEGLEVIWLAINSTYYMTTEDNIRWKETNHLHYHVLEDFSGTTAQHYQVKTTPQIFIINPEGILIYRGAIDNQTTKKVTNKSNILTVEEPIEFNNVAEVTIENTLAEKNTVHITEEISQEVKAIEPNNPEEKIENKQLNDDSEQSTKVINYLQTTLEASLANQAIIYPETEPDGCAIKYAY